MEFFCTSNTAYILGEIMKINFKILIGREKVRSQRDPDARVTVVAGVCSPPPLFAFWEFDGRDKNNLSL